MRSLNQSVSEGFLTFLLLANAFILHVSLSVGFEIGVSGTLMSLVTEFFAAHAFVLFEQVFLVFELLVLLVFINELNVLAELATGCVFTGLAAAPPHLA